MDPTLSDAEPEGTGTPQSWCTGPSANLTRLIFEWLAAQPAGQTLTVLVGSPSHHRLPATCVPCPEPSRCGRDSAGPPGLGGVAIPERHTRRGEEHLRLIAKREAGCSFFVTQVVYDVNAAKNLVSDYRHECAARGVEPVPIVFTFSVCGIAEDPGVPGMARRRRAPLDPERPAPRRRQCPRRLQASYEQSLTTARELMRVPRAPDGRSLRVNVPESVRRAIRLTGNRGIGSARPATAAGTRAARSSASAFDLVGRG